jgi:hypothetical protein
MKIEILKGKLDNQIIESTLDCDYDVIIKFNQEELALQLICIANEYAQSKLKEELSYLKELFFSAGSEDVKEYIDQRLK